MSPGHDAVLAQVNIARQRAPLDDPSMREFLHGLDVVNELAASSPGFVWRLRSSHAHGATTRTEGAHLVFVNVSVWSSYEALHDFVYRSAHGGYLRRRTRWFEPVEQPSTALWWTAAGTEPDADEGLRRLRHLRTYGPTPQAFSLRRRFDAAGRPVPRRLPGG